MEDMIALLGAGPHGRELANIAHRLGHGVAFFDDDPDIEDLVGPVEDFNLNAGNSRYHSYLIGAAYPAVRRAIAAKMRRQFVKAATLVDPEASIIGQNTLGDGVVVAAGARLTTDVRVGDHTHVGLNTTISRDCQIGAYATLCPGVGISGGVIVEDDVFVGAHAVVKNELVIGAGAFIGCGAVVVEDVKPGVTVIGNPARPQ
jgi:sugar O-acyltransferase (sialic acid O-acetyltransferase NeuD family)